MAGAPRSQGSAPLCLRPATKLSPKRNKYMVIHDAILWSTFTHIRLMDGVSPRGLHLQCLLCAPPELLCVCRHCTQMWQTCFCPKVNFAEADARPLGVCLLLLLPISADGESASLQPPTVTIIPLHTSVMSIPQPVADDFSGKYS